MRSGVTSVDMSCAQGRYEPRREGAEIVDVEGGWCVDGGKGGYPWPRRFRILSSRNHAMCGVTTHQSVSCSRMDDENIRAFQIEL